MLGAFLQACGYSDLFLPARPCCTACGLLETAKEKARVHQDNAPPSLPLGESNLCSRVGYVSTSFISSAADIVPSVSRWWFLVDSSFAISLRGKSPRQNPQLWVWDSNATGRRPSLTSSGCWWSISFTHASRSPPLLRPSANGIMENIFTVFCPQLASIALLSVHSPCLVRRFNSFKVWLSQTHSNHPHITSSPLSNTFTTL